MDSEDNSEACTGSTVHSKIKRGIIWGNEETSALIKVWGEAEIKYALSSLKRNIEIFEVISKELRKIGFQRSATECRTKCKSLRKLYKQAVIQNSTSGAGRSKFIWYEEMANIFRTDTSIHPLRTTESESTGSSAPTEAMPGGGDNVGSQSLFEESNCLNNSYAASETSAMESHSNDCGDASTSGCSSSQSPQATLAAQCGNRNSAESTNYEATLDPATRLALIRKRKQRSTAAARLDNTLSGFVDWVRASDEKKESTLNAWNHQDMMFQKEVIENLKVASTSLHRLTQFLTDTGKQSEVGIETGPSKSDERSTHRSESLMPTGSPKTVQGGNSDSDSDSTGKSASPTASDSDTDDQGSVSLLCSRPASENLKPKETMRGSSTNVTVQRKKGVLVPNRTPRTSTQIQGDVEPNFSVSPYLIVKQENSKDNIQTTLRTPPKRRRLKKKIFSP